MRIPQEVLQKANATGEPSVSSTKPAAQAHTTLDIALGFFGLTVLVYFVATVSIKTIKKMNLKRILRRALGMALILLLVKYEVMMQLMGVAKEAGKLVDIGEAYNTMGEMSIDVYIGAWLVSLVMID